MASNGPPVRTLSNVSLKSEKSEKSDKDKKKDDASNVNVVVRLRPPSDGEDISDVFTADGTRVTVRDPLSRGRMEHSFTFNRVFTPEHGQEVIFGAVARPLVDHLLAGFNSCCFAYGQTGSGKTHSVFGEGNAEQRGLLARSIEYLFDKIEAQSGHKEVGMVVSFLEIYLDQVRDLGRFYTERDKAQDAGGDVPGRQTSLSSAGSRMRNSASGKSLGSRPSSAHSRAESKGTGSRPSSATAGRHSRVVTQDLERDIPVMSTEDVYIHQDLAIHESPQGLVYVEDLMLIPVTNIREVLEVANLGVRARATYETRLNARSSRSHTIFSVSIVQKSRANSKNGVVGSVINFVDLAGSERLAKSQSEGRRFQEAVIINSSLSALGKVVLALASDKVRHIPYRDSKLTRILQNSLGGNSYTTLLTAIDPSAFNYEESLNSLFFADRCQNVQNKPVQNVVQNDDEAHEKIVARLTLEIANLKHQLDIQTTLAMGPSHMQHSRAGSQKGAPAATTAAAGGAAGVPGAYPAACAAVASSAAVAAGLAVGGVDPVQATVSGGPLQRAGHDAGLQLVHSQAMDRLQEERRAAIMMSEKVQKVKEEIEKGRLEQLEREDVKRKEAHVIRQAIKEVELEILKCRQQLSAIDKVFDKDRSEALRSLQGHSEEVKKERKVLASTFSEPLLQAESRGAYGSELVAMRNVEGKCAKREHAHKCVTKKLEESHVNECSMLSSLHQQWFDGRDREAESTEAKIEQYRAQGIEMRQQVSGELISAYDLVRQLSRVVDALETGMPNHHRTGLQPPGTPGPPQVTMPMVGSLPQSRRGSMMVGGAPSECGSTQPEAEYTAPSPRSVAGRLAALLTGLPEPPLRRDAKEIRAQLTRHKELALPAAPTRPGSARRGLGRIGASDTAEGAAMQLVPGGDAAWWDAERFAREFCDLRSGGSASSADAARATIQRLDPARLRALCLSLRRRARMSEAEKAVERSRLLDEVAQDLSQDNRVGHIRSLEKEIASYREKLADHEEQIRQAELALRHCSLSTTSLAAAGGGKFWPPG